MSSTSQRARNVFALVCLDALCPDTSLMAQVRPAAAAKFRQPDAAANADLFVWTDTCNVYVLRDGDSAVLIDFGDGSVVDHLKEIGIRKVEWVLLTHHHREQLQGTGRVDRSRTKIAAPEAERELLEQPTEFRKWFPKLGDRFSLYGASYVRPPQHAITLSRSLAGADVFTWQGIEFRCMDTPGHSPGSMSYIIRRDDHAIGFTGGVMHDGARMTTWFDTEWDYGFGKESTRCSIQSMN